MNKSHYYGLVLTAAGLLAAPAIIAQTITAPFAGAYTYTNLGPPVGVPAPFGGLTLKLGDPNTLLIGGAANSGAGTIFSVGLNRDSSGHITGFSGPAIPFAPAPYIDGGLSYGPANVLFFTGYPVNTLGQIEPGSPVPNKFVPLTGFGVAPSVGSLVFAPDGDLKLLSYNTGNWYSATLTPDGAGTFDVLATYNVTLPGGIEGAAYVPTGSAGFGPGSVLVAEYGLGSISTYLTDADFNPIAATRQPFMIGLGGAEGAFIDPLTGDFLFSTFGGGNRVVRVSGFTAPSPPSVPDASSTAVLLLLAFGAMTALWRRRMLT